MRYALGSDATKAPTDGWDASVPTGTDAGTRAEARRAELAGGLEDDYDVWYRVHAQGLGWMGWAKNGTGTGTTDKAKHMEACQIVILPKGSKVPGSTANSFVGKRRTSRLTRRPGPGCP